MKQNLKITRSKVFLLLHPLVVKVLRHSFSWIVVRTLESSRVIERPELDSGFRFGRQVKTRLIWYDYTSEPKRLFLRWIFYTKKQCRIYVPLGSRSGHLYTAWFLTRLLRVDLKMSFVRFSFFSSLLVWTVPSRLCRNFYTVNRQLQNPVFIKERRRLLSLS